jgi:hypothetical protein
VEFCGTDRLLQCDDYNSDHRPIFLKLRVQKGWKEEREKMSSRVRVKRGKVIPRDFSVLKNFEYQHRLAVEFERQLGMKLVKDATELTILVNSAVEKVLPKKVKKKNACWLTVNDVHVQKLLEDRRFAKLPWLGSERRDVVLERTYLEAKKRCRQKLRGMKREYFEEKSKTAQEAFNRNDSKLFCSIIDNFVPKKTKEIPDKILLKDGATLTTSAKAKSDRVTEHFQILLNQASSIPDHVDSFLPKQESNLCELEKPFTFE